MLLPRWSFINRLSQIGITLIPVVIGFLAGFNDVHVNICSVRSCEKCPTYFL